MTNWAIASTTYKNKDTDNSRNGYSRKTLRTSFGERGCVRSP
ncbi:MAG: hypothetical protein ACLRNW_04710 [Neglectibacter sp.]